jgi:hypothetical protein
MLPPGSCGPPDFFTIDFMRREPYTCGRVLGTENVTKVRKRRLIPLKSKRLCIFLRKRAV